LPFAIYRYAAPIGLGNLGEIAKGFSLGSVGRKAEGRVRWAAHTSSCLTMKRAERIVTLEADPFLRCGAALVLAHRQRGASSGGGSLDPLVAAFGGVRL